MPLTDLDVIVPDPKQVKFGGELYSVPADMPMEIFLRVNLAGAIKTEDGEDDQPGQINALVDCLVDLFIFEQPDGIDTAPIKEKVKKVLMRRGVKYGFTLLREIYKDEDDDAVDPPVEGKAVEVAAPVPPAAA